MKKIAVLGSTGSIGTQTLKVIRENPQKYQVTALSCRKNAGLLAEQVGGISSSMCSGGRQGDGAEAFGKISGNAVCLGAGWPRGDRSRGRIRHSAQCSGWNVQAFCLHIMPYRKGARWHWRIRRHWWREVRSSAICSGRRERSSFRWTANTAQFFSV